MRLRPRHTPRSGSVLLAVLIMVVLLSLAAYQFSELMVQEYAAAQSSLKATQAKAFADSGIYYAAAMLSDPTSVTGALNNNVYDNESSFAAQEVQTGESSRRTGRFSIVAAIDQDEASTSKNFRYGVVDESGKININALVRLDSSGQIAHNILMKLPNMTEEIADAIIDWIDADDNPRPNGAESATYAGMTPPYRCKNGPLDSIEELLLVKGVTPQLLFGTDRNRNGVQDPGEDDGNGFDPGWAAYLTVYSREINIDSTGAARTNLKGQGQTPTQLHDALTTAVGQELSDFIIMYLTHPTSAAGNARLTQASAQEISDELQSSLKKTSITAPTGFASLFQLVDANVTWTVTTGTGRQATTKTVQMPNPLKSNLDQLLPTLLDKVTTRSESELPAKINVMSASKEALSCLIGIAGVADTDVQTIMSLRPSTGTGDANDTAYDGLAWLVTQAKLPLDKVRALEQYITSHTAAHTQVYRVQSIGYFDKGGPIARVEAVIDTNNGKPRIVMYRDLTEFGKGYSLTK